MVTSSFELPKVKEFAGYELVTVSQGANVVDACKLMKESHVSLLVVVDDEKEIIGVLTAGELFNTFYLHAGAFVPRNKLTGKGRDASLEDQRLDLLIRRLADFRVLSVKEVMTRKIVSIPEEASVGDAIRLMKDTDLRRLLVTNEAGKIIGVVGRLQLMTALLKRG